MFLILPVLFTVVVPRLDREYGSYLFLFLLVCVGVCPLVFSFFVAATKQHHLEGFILSFPASCSQRPVFSL